MEYLWDDNGNLLSDGVYTYTYDTANRLVGVSGAGLAVSYSYNGLGDRLSETANELTTQYTMDLNAGLTQVLADGDNTYLYGVSRIAQYDLSGPQYFLGDALGSVRQLVDADGNVTLAKSYQPYGEVMAAAGDGVTSYGFTNEWTDTTGLVYLRARYYAPGQGRFLTKDMWEGDHTMPMSLNQWLYTNSNPITFDDPTGLYSQKQIKQILGVTRYEEVLDVFRNGRLAGKWAFLKILHAAKDYDGLTIYRFSQCQMLEEIQDPQPRIILPTYIINGVEYVVGDQQAGYLYLLKEYGLFLFDENNIGVNTLWYVPKADYFIHDPVFGGNPFFSWSGVQYPYPQLILDSVDMASLMGDSADLGKFLVSSISKSDPRLRALEIALKTIGVTVDAHKIWRALKPTINAVMQEKDPNAKDLEEILKVFRDIGYGEAIRDVDNNSIPVYQFINLIRNIGGAIKFVP